MPDPLDGIELITGDCREALAGMEAGSVQCVVSSPPYWSLRDYNLEPSVWGGDGEVCEHEWGEPVVKAGISGGKDNPFAEKLKIKGVENYQTVPETRSAFCSRCSAWRGCLGLEPTPDLFVAHIVEVMRGVWRVLREDGVMFLNLGDSYASSSSTGHGGWDGNNKNPDGTPRQNRQAGDRWSAMPTAVAGLKPKDLCCIPWRVAMALQADGWYLRAALPWVKRSAMPESANDRPNSAVEYVFQLTKQPRYYFDMESVRVALAPATVERDQYSRILENDGPQAVRHDHETQGNPAGRHFRNGDLWFQSISEPHGMVFLDDEPVGLDVNPAGFGEAHFATFPPHLVEPLIKSGTSEKGCCPKCRKAWERVIEREGATPRQKAKERGWSKKADGKGLPAQGLDYAGGHGSNQRDCRTLGWRPACSCDAGAPVPCTVCDMFSGAGTVALVAARLGRRAIGIEAKAEYNAMAEKRIGQALRPATYQDTSKPEPGAAPLFEETNP